MKSKTAILSIFWLVSLSAAYIVGAKISSPSQETAESNDSSEFSRPSYRGKVSSSSASSRAKSGSRKSSASNQSSKQNVTSIVANNDPIARVNNLLALIKGLAPNDFAQVVADFRATGLTRERMSEYGMLLHAWAKEDPLAALEYAEANTRTSFARQTILASWAVDNPDGAIQWAESNHDGDGGNPWLVGVIQGIVSTNPSKATEIMQSMAFSRERSDALENIVPYITQLGQEKAVEWIESIEDERLRSGATRRVAEQLARTDPEATAAWVTSIESEESRNRAIGEVADTWADQDVASAVAWTETLSGNDKTRAARELIGEYTREDPEQAAAWVNTFSGTDGYDQVATSFIRNTAETNPELALSTISTLQNTNNQNRYSGRILNNWYRVDAAAAEAWMQANNISDELRQRATRTRDNNRRGR